MATKDYSATRATATRLIEKFGGAASFVPLVKSGPSYDPTVTEGTAQSVSAVVVDYTARERQGTSIEEGDRRALVTAATGVDTPTIETILRMGGVDYQIREVGVVQPAGPSGLVVVYDLRVRA